MKFLPVASRRFRLFAPFRALAVTLAVSASVATLIAQPAGDPASVALPTNSWAGFVETNFPFFSSVLDARKLGAGLPADNLTPRGIVLNLGHDCWACFDTELLRMSAVWTGAAVTPVSMAQISYHATFTKAEEGQTTLPRIVGEPWIANGLYPGWQVGEQLSQADPRPAGPDPKEPGRGPLPPGLGRFLAVRLTRDGVCLEYEVNGVLTREWVEARVEDGRPVVQRSFYLERVRQPLTLALGRKSAAITDRLTLDFATDWIAGKPGALLTEEPGGLLLARLNQSDRAVAFRVAMGLTPATKTWEGPHGSPADGPPAARWPQSLTTHVEPSVTQAALVVDNIALPLDNPWHRNVRLADVAFFRDGRAAAVTFDGDVWLIDGLGAEGNEIRWRRFASGFHEPLSLCVRDGEIFVFDRNGIWRLRDSDGHGEADVYALFSNAFTQTAETREFANGMKLAPDGSFIIAKGGIQMTTLGTHNGSVLRVAPNGQSAELLAYGLREPFIGVNPKTGLITASDQQGHYVPTTPLHVIRDRQFYGFLSRLLPKEQYPAAIADPLTWIPYPVNASGASQVWLTDAKMGRFNDALIHLAYYRPEVFLVLTNQRTPRLQAAVVSITRDLQFSPLNGAVNPRDGQLYVTGFQIFGTTAKQVSGLARVRYTGLTSSLPREVIAMDKGVLLRFDTPLDERTATNVANFSAERWNYQRTFNYGSPHFKTNGEKGQDAMPPSSAYLSRKGESVFVGIPDMKRVMQMRIGWALTNYAGVSFAQNAYFTPYELPAFDPVAEGFPPLTVDLTPRAPGAIAATPQTADEGRRLAELMGCAGCHSNDGTTLGKVGPSWKGLFGSDVALADGAKVAADEAYLRESILTPAAKIVRGFEKTDTAMPSYAGLVSDAQINALILYIKSLR